MLLASVGHELNLKRQSAGFDWRSLSGRTRISCINSANHFNSLEIEGRAMQDVLCDVCLPGEASTWDIDDGLELLTKEGTH